MLTQKGLRRVLIQCVVQIYVATPERMGVQIIVPIVANLAILERISVVLMSLGSEQGPVCRSHRSTFRSGSHSFT